MLVDSLSIRFIENQPLDRFIDERCQISSRKLMRQNDEKSVDDTMK